MQAVYVAKPLTHSMVSCRAFFGIGPRVDPMKGFLFCTVLLTSVLVPAFDNHCRIRITMAKEFTSDIVERKNLPYVAHGGPSQTLDLYAPKKAKDVPFDCMDPWRRLCLWLQRGIPG